MRIVICLYPSIGLSPYLCVFNALELHVVIM
uniref:Uncharacterized protein n=1 Tax=Arundo donax TaxID=35708 RepID=A0A0A8XS25_ARUDO